MALSCLKGCFWIVALLSIIYVTDASLSGHFSLTHELTARKNQELTIDCRVPHGFLPQNQTANVRWTKNGVPIRTSANIRVLENGSLYLRQVKLKKRKSRSDEGLYRCFATNSLGTVLASRTSLNVAYISRRIAVEPSSQVAPPSSKVFFRCAITGHPAPSISWTLENQPILNSSQSVRLHSCGVLEVISVSARHRGSYRCVATNQAGVRISDSAQLQIGDPQTVATPRLVQGPSNQTTLIGDSVTFSCLVRGRPRPQIKWWKDGNHVDARLVNADDELVIRNVQVENEGCYSCHVEDGSGAQLFAADAFLTVLEPPSLSTKPSAVETYNDNKVHLSCTVGSGYPKPTVTWLRNGQPLHRFPDFKCVDGDLSFEKAFTYNSGYYQCVAENEAGVTTAYAHLSVKMDANAPHSPTNVRARVLSSSEVVLSWDESVTRNGHVVVAYTYHYYPTAVFDKPTTLDCLASSHSFYPLDGVIQPEERSIRVGALSAYTNYTFYLNAYSAHATSDPTQKITVLMDSDVPNQPPRFDVLSHGPQSIKITWRELSPEQARGEVLYYTVYYRLHHDDSWKPWKLSADSKECIITGLEPKKPYDVYVVAETDKGVTAFRNGRIEYKTVSTLATVNRNVPKTPNIQVWALNSSAIKINWLISSINHLQGFRLRLQGSDDSRQTAITVPPNVSIHTFTQLEANHWYQVEVHAFTSLVDGHPAIKFVKTLPVGLKYDETVPPPMDIAAHAQSNTTVQVAWSMSPDFSMFISHFSVRYQPVFRQFNGSGDGFHLQENIHDSKLLVTGLLPYTLYLFSVRCHSARVAGPFGDSVQVRTKEGLPQPPAFNQILPFKNSIRLRWLPPLKANGVVSAYKVTFCDKKARSLNMWSVMFAKGSEHEIEMFDLDMDTVYYIRIQSKTRAGFGEMSQEYKIRTSASDLELGGVREYENGDNPSKSQGGLSDQMMGIIIGVAIGVGCLVICVVIVTCMKRSHRCNPHYNQHYHVNGYHSNGHACHDTDRLAGIGDRLSHSDSVELENLTNRKTNGKRNGKNGHTNGKKHANGHSTGSNGECIHRNSHTDHSQPHQPNGHIVNLDSSRTHHAVCETSLDDIDRSYRGDDSEEECSAVESLIPQGVDTNSDSHVHFTSHATSTPLPQLNGIGTATDSDCIDVLPPLLSTFKPHTDVSVS